MTDDAVHINQAAKALGVSRRTVERMIERGELDRDMSHDGATVTKKSLVAALERRRGEPVDVSRLSQAVSRQPASTDATTISLLLQRLEEQAAEIGQLRQLTKQADSLKDDRDRLEVALHEERAKARTAEDEADALRKLAESSWFTRRKLRRTRATAPVRGAAFPLLRS